MLAEGSGGNAQGVPRRVHSAPQPRPPREPVQIDVDAVRDVVQELYGPGLRQVGRSES